MDAEFSATTWAVFIATVMVAALAHGLLGVGFPMIATPVVAILTDVKTSVMLTLLPNIAVNLASMLRGANPSRSMRRHWPVAVYVVIGTVIGTRALLHVDPDLLRMLLAAMILVFLIQDHAPGATWPWVKRYPKASAAGFGLLAGVVSGATNVTAPPLLIYFMAMGLSSAEMIPVLNLCFISAKLTQLILLGAAGVFTPDVLRIALVATCVALLALFAGGRVRDKINERAYRNLAKLVLFLLAAGVAWQAAENLLARYMEAGD